MIDKKVDRTHDGDQSGTGFECLVDSRARTGSNDQKTFRIAVMLNEFRLSRLKAPRGTFATMVLIAVVFLLFGAFASLAQPDSSGFETRPAASKGLLITNWLIGG